MTENTEIRGIYLGNRGEEFKTLITSVLNLGKIKVAYVKLLTEEESLDMYASAFTSDFVDHKNNYQVLEQLGDLVANKFIVNYIHRRFPQLSTTEGVKIVARLRINYGSRNSFFEIANKLGFWDFISATNDMRMRKQKDLLEDVFEAFLGVTEKILDDKLSIGVGNAICYKILSAIFDGMDISLKYEDLYDAKTRLKELFDMCSDKLGPLRYEETKEENITISCAYRLQGAMYETRPNGTVNTNKIVGKYVKILIGQGSASLQADAQQHAAADAIRTLARQGYVKKPPAIYAKMTCAEPPVEKVTTREDVIGRCENDEKKINEQFFTRGKSKYQTKYTSTLLGMYCHDRNYAGVKECLKLGADPNVPDSERLSALDLLLIGKVDKKMVRKVIKRFFLSVQKIKIHKNIFEVYYSKYTGSYFGEIVDQLEFINESEELEQIEK